jgi:hypothetical protein
MTLSSYLLDAARPIYSKLMVAVVIIFLGLIVGKLAGKLAHKLLSEVELDRALHRRIRMNLRVEQSISSVVMYALHLVFVVWALDVLGVGRIVIIIVTGSIMVLIIVSLFLGVKDFVPNAIAGIFIHWRGAGSGRANGSR